MASFTDWLNKLGLKSEISDTIREPLKRSASFLSSYENWLSEEMLDTHLYALKVIREAEVEGAIDSWITYMHNPKSRGIIFRSHQELPDFSWMYFMEHIKQKLVAEHHYILQHSLDERKIQNKKVHGKEVYYLKPRTGYDPSQKLMQKFGNIRLEYRHINDDFTEFRIQATYYQGFNYGEIKPFEDLFH